MLRTSVMIASDLLLTASHGIGRGVGVKQTTTIRHVLERDSAAKDWLQRVFAKVVTSQVSLEERRHLCVAWPGAAEDEEVDLEAQHVNCDGRDDQA